VRRPRLVVSNHQISQAVLQKAAALEDLCVSQKQEIELLSKTRRFALEKSYRKRPSCSFRSNSEGAGGPPQGGNLKPFKSDPFHSRICSDFVSSLLEIGSLNFRGRFRISGFGGRVGVLSAVCPFDCLMTSALFTRSLHFESKYFFWSGLSVILSACIYSSAALIVASRESRASEAA
jgi:hypothetical protein